MVLELTIFLNSVDVFFIVQYIITLGKIVTVYKSEKYDYPLLGPNNKYFIYSSSYLNADV